MISDVIETRPRYIGWHRTLIIFSIVTGCVSITSKALRKSTKYYSEILASDRDYIIIHFKKIRP